MTRRRRLSAALLVPGGLLLSHAGAYAIAGADPHVTGHGGPLHGDTTLLVVLATAAAATAAALELRRSDARGSVRLLGWAGAALAAVYVLMELAERAAHGVPVGEALREPTLRYGFVVQLAMTVGAVLLVRVGSALRARSGRRWQPARRQQPPSDIPRWLPTRPLPTGTSRRGPPLRSAA